MSRQGKTKIGGEDTAGLSERTNEASARGYAAQAQAQAGLTEQRNRNQENVTKTSMEIAGMEERNRQMKQQRDIEGGRQAIDQQKIDMQAASEGYQRGAGATTSPLVDEQQQQKQQDPRQQKLQQEMDRGGDQTKALYGDQIGPPTPDQQRRQDQANKPMEMSGSAFVPTEQGRGMQTRKNFEADTERVRAEAYRDQVRSQLIKANATGDVEEQKSLRANLMQPLKGEAKLLTAFASGKIQSDDWDAVKAMAKDNPANTELQQEVASGVPGPRIRSMLSASIAHKAMQFIDDTHGDLPDGNVVDFTSPQMQQFTYEVGQAGKWIAMQGKEYGEFLNLQTFEDKIKYQNALAAKSILKGTTSPQSQGPFQGVTPSAGGAPQGGQQPPAPGGAGPAPGAAQPARNSERRPNMSLGHQ